MIGRMAWNTTESQSIIRFQLEGDLSEMAVKTLLSMPTPQMDAVIDITSANELSHWEALLAVQAEWMANGFSAVILASEEQLTVFDGLELPMAPTWQECLDLIEMERIERQLGM